MNIPSPLTETEIEARAYAWAHFAYHAQQRQTVFNFFLILVGGCIAAFVAMAGKSDSAHLFVRGVIGFLLALASLLFWRLDRRNAYLVKVAEASLAKREIRLSDLLGDDSIRLMELSEKKSSRFPMSMIESFGQIYRLIFLITGTVGVAVCLWSIGSLICHRAS